MINEAFFQHMFELFTFRKGPNAVYQNEYLTRNLRVIYNAKVLFSGHTYTTNTDYYVKVNTTSKTMV